MPTRFERNNVIDLLRTDYSNSDWTNRDNSNAAPIDLDTIITYENAVVEVLVDAFRDTETTSFNEIIWRTNDSISSWFQQLAPYELILPKGILLPESFNDAKHNARERANETRRFKEHIARRISQAITFENDKLLPDGLKLSDTAAHTQAAKTGKHMPQVFLSYQYVDRLYTIGLYYAFLREGFYLYADWMHNELIDDTSKLKEMLFREVLHSDHFASLPSVKAAFGVNDDRNQTTSWCAWEIGARRERTLLYNDKKVLISVSNYGNYDGIFKTFFEAHSMDDVLAVW